MGVELKENQADQLASYGELIEKWNRSVNLVSRADIRRLDARHLLDSLASRPFLAGKTLLDVGTGPGLPGIPLAIAMPETTVTLWERMSKRIRFLQMVCRELRLQNVHVVERDMQDTDQADNAECFDTIVARAVTPINQLWPLMSSRLSPKGQLIVYSHVIAATDQMARDDVDLRGAAMRKSQSLNLKEVPYTVPGIAATHYLQMVAK